MGFFVYHEATSAENAGKSGKSLGNCPQKNDKWRKKVVDGWGTSRLP